MNIGERIRSIRTETGLTLKCVAGRADMSVSFLSDIEHGRSNPSLEMLERIAEALGVTLVCDLVELGTGRAALDYALAEGALEELYEAVADLGVDYDAISKRVFELHKLINPAWKYTPDPEVKTGGITLNVDLQIMARQVLAAAARERELSERLEWWADWAATVLAERDKTKEAPQQPIAATRF